MDGEMVIAAVALLVAIYGASLLQYGGAGVAAEHLAWIVGLGILAVGAGMAGRAAL